MAINKTKAQARIPVSSRRKFKEIAEKEMGRNKDITTETQVLIDLIESEYNQHFNKGGR